MNQCSRLYSTQTINFNQPQQHYQILNNYKPGNETQSFPGIISNQENKGPNPSSIGNALKEDGLNEKATSGQKPRKKKPTSIKYIENIHSINDHNLKLNNFQSDSGSSSQSECWTDEEEIALKSNQSSGTIPINSSLNQKETIVPVQSEPRTKV